MARPAAEPYLAASAAEAHRLGHNYVGTAHVLLVLVRDREGGATMVLQEVGVTADAVEEPLSPCIGGGAPKIDADALATLGIDFQAVRERLEDTFGPGALERVPASLGIGPRLSRRSPTRSTTPKGSRSAPSTSCSACSVFPTRSPPTSSPSLASPCRRPRRSSRAAVSSSARTVPPSRAGLDARQDGIRFLASACLTIESRSSIEARRLEDLLLRGRVATLAAPERGAARRWCTRTAPRR